MSEEQGPRKLGIGVKLAYGVGSMGFAAKDAAFVNFVPFFYTQVVGLSGTLYGAAALVGQIADAITDPLVGTISDNHRSRWGRRHPFMALSILPLALCFLMLFNPPAGLGQIGLFLWLAFVAVCLRTALTAFAIPHAALGAELSTDYEERSTVVSYRTTLGWFAGVALPFAGLAWLFARGGEGDGRLLASNYVDYGWLSAGVAAVTIAISVYFTRKQIPFLPSGGPRRRFDWRDPIRDVVEALRNRNFRWVFVASILFGAISGVSVTLGFYTNTYFWGFSSVQVGILSASSVLPTIVVFILLRPLQHRFEKKHIFFAAGFLLVLNSMWWIGGRLIGILPENGDPWLYRIAFVHQFLLVASVWLVQVMSPSMVADVADEFEVETGARRDGIFFAAMGFALKVPTGLGQFVGGVLIDVIALPSGVEPGQVEPGVLFRLGVVAGPLIGLAFLAPVLSMLPFRLDRRRHAALRAQLDERVKQTT